MRKNKDLNEQFEEFKKSEGEKNKNSKEKKIDTFIDKKSSNKRSGLAGLAGLGGGLVAGAVFSDEIREGAEYIADKVEESADFVDNKIDEISEWIEVDEEIIDSASSDGFSFSMDEISYSWEHDGETFEISLSDFNSDGLFDDLGFSSVGEDGSFAEIKFIDGDYDSFFDGLDFAYSDNEYNIEYSGDYFGQEISYSGSEGDFNFSTDEPLDLDFSNEISNEFENNDYGLEINNTDFESYESFDSYSLDDLSDLASIF